MVSWYGSEFAGRKTASGEVFDPKELTVAHRSLAFGTEVQFFNPANKRSVVARVNDRGPFVHQREFDLSEAAGRRLGILSQGVAKLKYQVLE